VHGTVLPETFSQIDSAVHPREETKRKGRRWSLLTVQNYLPANFGPQNVKFVNLQKIRNFRLSSNPKFFCSEKCSSLHFMGQRLTRISTYLHFPIMSNPQEAMKKAFTPSQNWLTFQKTLRNSNEAPSKKRKRRSEDQTQDQSKSAPSVVRHPKLTNYDPWHPSDQFRRQQTGNSALLLHPKSSYKFKV